MYNLTGKVALVTGTGGKNGIGRAIATRLAKEGADVAVNDITEHPYAADQADWQGLPDVVQEIEAMGQRAISVVADVSDAKQVGEMVDKTVAHFGKIDILVNNAGTIAGKDRVPVVHLAEEDWDRVQRVNVKGVFLLFTGSGTSSHRAGHRGQNYQYVFCYGETRVSALCCIQCLEIRCDWLYTIACV